MSAPASTSSSIDAADVARFSAIAEDWWDPRGKFAPLHALNPVRLGFIRERALARFQREGRERAPFQGLRALDVGCGGGLICEPLARLGFDVTGLDASERNVAFARLHADAMGLDIDYRAGSVEELLASAEPAFDLVVSMEVVEHVTDPGAFLRDCADLTATGGMMIIATLNRTLKSLALAKIAAEHLLRWLPAGTHDWRKFVRPDEIRAHLESAGLKIEGPYGAALDPLSGRWSISQDVSINYFMAMSREDKRTAAS
jgi:2-polyprenyl-6-hydroxyphenyl methylase/3-demethylubiquinone-9 3-methyltransferase